MTQKRTIPFYQWLREKRLKLLMTQADVAELLNVSVRTIQRWEANATDISDENLSHIMKVFRLKVENG